VELVLFADRRLSRIEQAFALAPALDNRVHRAETGEASVRRGRLQGNTAVLLALDGEDRPVPHVFEVDAGLSDGGTGTFRCRHPLPDYTVGEVTGVVSCVMGSPFASQRQESITPGRGYPCWRGPYGTGSAPACGAELVDSLWLARLLWISEDRIPGSTPHDVAGTHVCGGSSAPIVAQNCVYLRYYAPAGPVVDGAKTRESRRLGTPGKERWFTQADEVIHCFDARSGVTLWRTVFRERGLNLTAPTRAAGDLTPCFHGGRVYAAGTAGVVLCVEASTGEPVWESTVGPRFLSGDPPRRWGVSEATLVPPDRPGYGFVNVIGGVVVSGDFEEPEAGGGSPGAFGLLGLDASTGIRRWRVPACIDGSCAPVGWLHEDQEYVLAVTRQTATCLDPQTGTVRWRRGGVLSGEPGTVPVTANYLVAYGDGVTCGLSCFQIDPGGASPLWSLAPEYTARFHSPLISRGHVYALCDRVRQLVCVDLATGAIRGSAPGEAVRSSLVGADGRLLKEGLLMYEADRREPKPLGDPWPVDYAESTTPAIADGRLFFRSRNALLCYDLRRDVTAATGAAPLLTKATSGEDKRLAEAARRALKRLRPETQPPDTEGATPPKGMSGERP
jgi:outer membrane protein assembly factor BamB